MSERLELLTEQDHGRVLVRLSGELDIGSADEVERALRSVEEPDRDVVLDLTRLGFIDSTGLRLIISADLRAREGGWRLSIVPGPGRVQRVFQVAGLERRLPFTGEVSGDGDAD